MPLHRNHFNRLHKPYVRTSPSRDAQQPLLIDRDKLPTRTVVTLNTSYYFQITNPFFYFLRCARGFKSTYHFGATATHSTLLIEVVDLLVNPTWKTTRTSFWIVAGEVYIIADLAKGKMSCFGGEEGEITEHYFLVNSFDNIKQLG